MGVSEMEGVFFVGLDGHITEWNWSLEDKGAKWITGLLLLLVAMGLRKRGREIMKKGVRAVR